MDVGYRPVLFALALNMGLGGCSDDSSASESRVGVDTAVARDSNSSAESDAVQSEGGAINDLPKTPGDMSKLSPEARRFLDELGKLKANQSADLDGDGKKEITINVKPDGTVIRMTDSDSNGIVEFRVEKNPDGSWKMMYDADQNKVSDWTWTLTPGSPPVRITTWDRDLNGKIDQRITSTLDLAKEEFTQLIEKDPEEDGTFVVQSKVTRSHWREAGAACLSRDGFPSTSGPSRALFHDDVKLLTGNSAGRCNASSEAQIVNAYIDAITTGLDCLRSTNQRLANMLENALSDPPTDLNIGCGNVCPGSAAVTAAGVWWVPGQGDTRMNINPDNFNKMTPAERSGVMLHELLHWAGEEVDGGPRHNAGTDHVYACGRYCGGCNSRGKGAPNDSSVDCARCADTKAKKKACGVQQKHTEVKCTTAALCHGGIGKNGPCETCKGIQQQACDGTPLDVGTFSCCATCPANLYKNDIPCGASDPSNWGTCGQKPPGCK